MSSCPRGSGFHKPPPETTTNAGKTSIPEKRKQVDRALPSGWHVMKVYSYVAETSRTTELMDLRFGSGKSIGGGRRLLRPARAG